MIGGRSQSGRWLIDARFNKSELIKRIENIVDYRHRINVSNLDSLVFLDKINEKITNTALIYLDPPYYNKGQHLYTNYYLPEDHIEIADYVQQSIHHPWIVTYDDCPEIRRLYSQCNVLAYRLGYSARSARVGQEVLFYSDKLTIDVA